MTLMKDPRQLLLPDVMNLCSARLSMFQMQYTLLIHIAPCANAMYHVPFVVLIWSAHLY